MRAERKATLPRQRHRHLHWNRGDRTATTALVTTPSAPGHGQPDRGRSPEQPPETPDAHAGARRPTAVQEPACKLTIVIVEDDVASGSAIRAILVRKGCAVHMASNLEEGLKLLELRPDHVILDLMLPDGSGVEILRRASRDLRIKVTVTTALADPIRLEEVRSLNPHRILRKPIDLVDLLRAIGMM